jgi:hypothetical protein
VKVRLIRSDDDLDDGVQVVRGGLLVRDVLRADACRMFAVYGLHGVSVFALRGVPIDELAQQPPLVRFAELTILRVGMLRGAGLRLEPTGRNPLHFTVVMDRLEEGADALCACEHAVWSNPYYEA